MRSVAVELQDSMRFNPSELRAKRGETVRFVVRNSGKLPHEFVIGQATALKEHAAQMRQAASGGHSGHEHHGNDHASHTANTVAAVSVPAGQQAELIVRFDAAGTLGVACLVPGHSEAGMTGRITVAP